VKPGEKDLLLEANKYTPKDPALLELVRKLRSARQAFAADDYGDQRIADEYDKAYDRLFVAVGKLMDAEGERQAQLFPRREA